MENELFLHLDKIHTTDMEVDRIKRNLNIGVTDVVQYCHDKIVKADARIERIGKVGYYH